MLGRRDVLVLGALGALAACSSDPQEPRVPDVRPERQRYGDHAAQWADLYRPPGRSRGVVVVIHGGFWKAAYGADLGAPLAADLARRGWTAWNLEYRRVGDGGGVPETLDDVAAGIDLLADVPGLDLGTVLTLGHSAGGHLATWAAARGRFPRWQPARVAVTGVVSQAGVIDLDAAAERHLGSDAVDGFLGRPWSAAGTAERERVDPLRQVPLEVPVRCVHGAADDVVPIALSEAYVDAARSAGADARLLRVDGDHFVVIDVGSDAWGRTVELLDGLT